ADKAYLEGMYRNAYFRTVDTWASVAACRLSTANIRSVRSAPAAALAVIANGLVFAGSDNLVRNVRPLLDASDVIMSPLQSDAADVRETAMAALGTLGKT